MVDVEPALVFHFSIVVEVNAVIIGRRRQGFVVVFEGAAPIVFIVAGLIKYLRAPTVVDPYAGLGVAFNVFDKPNIVDSIAVGGNGLRDVEGGIESDYAKTEGGIMGKIYSPFRAYSPFAEGSWVIA